MQIVIVCLLAFFGVTAYAGKDDLRVSDCGNGDTFTRQQAWTCAMRAMDTNNDGALDGVEIDAAKAKYLYWYERSLGWIMGPTKVENVMKKCDSNGDNRVDSTDFAAMKYTCMPYMDPDYNWERPCEALCRVKTLCDRATVILHKPTY